MRWMTSADVGYLLQASAASYHKAGSSLPSRERPLASPAGVVSRGGGGMFVRACGATR